MSSDNWEPTRLNHLIEIKHGFAFKGEYFSKQPTEYVLVTPGNFEIGGGFKADNLKYYDGPIPEGYVLDVGDVIVTMTDLSKAADTLGYSAKVPPSPVGLVYLHNQRIGLIILKDEELADKSFLFWLLRSDEYRNYVVGGATGTTVRHTSPSRILGYEFLLPKKEEQIAIAKVLGDLDDKIDLLRKMNRTLEDIVRAVFRAWFVDFEPVRVKAAGATSFRGIPQPLFDQLPDSFTPSELGDIPTGWTLCELSELIEINPTRSLKKGTEATYLGMSDVPTSGPTAETWATREFNSGMKFQNGDTLLARITPCLENGKTALVDFLEEGEIGWGSTEFIVLAPQDITPKEFNYCLARDERFREYAIKNMTGTSGRQRVSHEAISSYVMAKPPKDFLERFGNVAEPLFERISANRDEMAVLAALRDTLLPKLISGELPAPDLEALGMTPSEPAGASDGE